MRLAGVLLLVLCSSMTGVFMASGLSGRVSAIDRSIRLADFFRDRLRYLQPTMLSLVESACGSPELAKIPYLADCRERMHRGESFGQAFRTAVKQHPGALGKEEVELLVSLADVLGVTDLDSQLTALGFVREQLHRCHADACQNREKHQKLYSTLGVLAGLAVAIILI